ncbi:hypothetical protein ACROYT_G014634 [Oculina patagonica]
MDSAPKSEENEIEKLSGKIPALSDYAAPLESHVKRQYLQKISVVGVDPANIPFNQIGPECLLPIEQSDLFSYLVLQTSFYTNDQFKNYKSLEAYNQVVLGFVALVQGKVISGKYVVVAKVRHSQHMNDPLVWIIADTDGTIFSAHCLGCKAGLAESCSHVASTMFYIQCWTRVNGKMTCMQVKCAWLLPTYVSEVSYERVRNIDFSSAKKLKENLDTQIDSLNTVMSCHEGQQSNVTTSTAISSHSISEAEMDSFYEELNKCETKQPMPQIVIQAVIFLRLSPQRLTSRILRRDVKFAGGKDEERNPDINVDNVTHGERKQDERDDSFAEMREQGEKEEEGKQEGRTKEDKRSKKSSGDRSPT